MLRDRERRRLGGCFVVIFIPPSIPLHLHHRHLHPPRVRYCSIVVVVAVVVAVFGITCVIHHVQTPWRFQDKSCAYATYGMRLLLVSWLSSVSNTPITDSMMFVCMGYQCINHSVGNGQDGQG
jgi:hypothetical protein